MLVIYKRQVCSLSSNALTTRSGDFLCNYGGCHHVLWNHRGDFVNALLYLILDKPQDRNHLKYFSKQTVIPILKFRLTIGSILLQSRHHSIQSKQFIGGFEIDSFGVWRKSISRGSEGQSQRTSRLRQRN